MKFTNQCRLDLSLIRCGKGKRMVYAEKKS